MGRNKEDKKAKSKLGRLVSDGLAIVVCSRMKYSVLLTKNANTVHCIFGLCPLSIFLLMQFSRRQKAAVEIEQAEGQELVQETYRGSPFIVCSA